MHRTSWWNRCAPINRHMLPVKTLVCCNIKACSHNVQANPISIKEDTTYFIIPQHTSPKIVLILTIFSDLSLPIPSTNALDVKISHGTRGSEAGGGEKIQLTSI